MSQKQDNRHDKVAEDGIDGCLRLLTLQATNRRSIDLNVVVPQEILARIFILMANSYPGPDMANPLEYFDLISNMDFSTSNTNFSTSNMKVSLYEEDERADAAEEVRRLAIVCRNWRDIINGTPQLWTTFRFLFAIRKMAEGREWSLGHLDAKEILLLSTHRFQLSRERSKTQLLDWWLDLRLLPSADEFMKLWNQYVQPVLPRLASLTLLGGVAVHGWHDLKKFIPSIWADLQAAQHLAELRFVGVEEYFCFQDSDINTGQKIIPHFPNLRTLIICKSRIPTLHAPRLSNLFIADQKPYLQMFGEQLSGVPRVERIILRSISTRGEWILPPKFEQSGLDLLESLEITSCDLGPCFKSLLTSGRLKSLTMNFPWSGTRPDGILAELTKLKLKLSWTPPQDDPHLILETSRDTFSFLEQAFNLEILEFADVRLGFLDALLQGFLANTDGTLLCPRLRSIRLSGGVIIFPSILIRLLQQRGRSANPNFPTSSLTLTSSKLDLNRGKLMLRLPALRDADSLALKGAIARVSPGYPEHNLLGHGSKFDIEKFEALPGPWDRLEELKGIYQGLLSALETQTQVGHGGGDWRGRLGLPRRMSSILRSIPHSWGKY